MKERHAAGIYLLLAIAGLVLGIIAGGEIMRFMYERRIHRYGNAEQNEPGTSGSFGDAGTESGARGDRGGMQLSITESRGGAIVTATKKVTPCVVGIVVTQVQVVNPSYYSGDFFDLFFGPRVQPRYREVENMGSGVIIDDRGLILTNNHVVEGAAKLFVNFPDGKQEEAKIVGRDPYSDLAVLSAEDTKRDFAVFGNSEALELGEWVIAIGNPFLNFINDPRPTVTVGVVSAVNRNFAPSSDVYYQGMIQTDAAINPGNSGGPLINARGEVIGINTFIFTGSNQSKGSIGIGFAIPANRAKRVIKELVNFGNRRPVWTGITVQDIDRTIALTLGVKTNDGVVVTGIQRLSPGASAGLRQGDVIVRMGDRVIRSHGDLEGFFLDYFVGDTVVVGYLRSRKKMNSELVLKEYPAGQ